MLLHLLAACVLPLSTFGDGLIAPAPASISDAFDAHSSVVPPTAAPEPKGAQQPNLFLFVADDLRNDDTVGSRYTGNARVDTPSIDGFARGGIDLSRMYTPIAICAPARQALMSGMYPVRSGSDYNHGRAHASTVETLPFYLRRLGYWTVQSGNKNHHLLPQDNFWFDQYIVAIETTAQGVDLSPAEVMQAKLNLDYMARLDEHIVARKATHQQPGPWFILHQSMEPHGPFDKDGNHSFYNYPDNHLGDTNLLLNPTKFPYADYLSALNMNNDVMKMDREFGSFLGILRTRFAASQKSVTIFTSDHGGLECKGGFRNFCVPCWC